MAHVAKFNKGAMGHMLAHYDRSKDCGDNVDKERTHLNYNLAAHQQLTQLEFIHTRLSEVKVQNRKDVNVLCDWVVTIPKDFLAEHPDKEKIFFESVYRFLEKEYGKENVVSAYVHKDETTPHLHFAFIPVVYDKKKERYKVSAKECITRADLKRFHSDLEEHVSRELGLKVNIENGATKEGNLTVPQLKTQQERSESLQKANELFEFELQEKRKILEEVEKMCPIKSVLELEQMKTAADSELFELSHVFDEVDEIIENLADERELPQGFLPTLVDDLIFVWNKCVGRFSELLSNVQEKIKNIELFEKIKNVPEKLRSSGTLTNRLMDAKKEFEQRNHNIQSIKKEESREL